MNWNETEPWPGQYEWTRLDDAVRAAHANGLAILGLIAGPAPAWAGKFPGVPGSPPRNPHTYAAFAAAVAQRYRAHIDTWEVWNEPNLRSYWVSPNASEYTALLKATYPRIKAANHRATVLTGGVSSFTDAIEGVEFVRRIYLAGGGQYFDGVGIHPYTLPFAMGQDPHKREQMIPRIRAIMDAAGHSQKRIWVTEWGQATGTGPVTVSEAEQATMTVATLRYLAGIPRLGPVFLYTSRDWSTDISDTELNFGLYRTDYSAKPVVERLRSEAG